MGDSEKTIHNLSTAGILELQGNGDSEDRGGGGVEMEKTDV